MSKGWKMHRNGPRTGTKIDQNEPLNLQNFENSRKKGSEEKGCEKGAARATWAGVHSLAPAEPGGGSFTGP